MGKLTVCPGEPMSKNNAVYVHQHDKHTLTNRFGGGVSKSVSKTIESRFLSVSLLWILVSYVVMIRSKKSSWRKSTR